MTDNTYDDLIRTLQLRDDLSPADLGLIQSLPFRKALFPRGAEIIAQDSEVTESCLLTKGWAGRAVFLENGKRQITAIHISGDFVDLHGFTLKYMDHSVIALSPLQVAFVKHDDIRRVTARSPHLARLFWTLTTIDGAIQRTMIASLGRRPALQRLGHFLCEIDLRLSAVGLCVDHSFELPLTQEECSDILGLSGVHMNRTIQDIRQTGFVTWQANKVSIHDFAKLPSFSGFDDRFLNLIKRDR